MKFSGVWATYSADYGSSTWKLRLLATVTSGALVQTAVLDIVGPTATFELDYTAGQSVSVGITDLNSFSIVGAGSISATKLRISCQLFMR